ncbi:SDR family oxidoreductase [Nocardioides conyzicola]|uniref:SDR family oxidoreductase n=1 Tax=Nocardioides conyzicola TaxID=1651781 RepID=A0ABP8X4C8_9ACTN
MTANTYAFAGKTVFITGGGSGIGRAIAKAFLANGANVAIGGRRRERLLETLAGEPADRTLAVEVDVSDGAAVDAAVSKVIERFGQLDVVVSNAAAYAHGDFVDLGGSEWETIRSTNIDGFVHIARRTLPELERTGGNLVAVGSVSGFRGDWGQALYNASKAAVMNFIQSLALDYGERGVRLNAVAPAATRTEMTEAFSQDEAAVAAATNRVALGRLGEPIDVAPAVLFLASDDARYITGAWLPVDGGTSASTGQAH